MFGQSDMGTNLLHMFVRIQFQINHFLFSEKYANVIHRQGATIRCMVKSL